LENFVVSATSGTVERFVELVRGIESIYPTWSAERLNDELRVLGGYGDSQFKIVLGDPRPFSTLLTDLGSLNSPLPYKNILLELKSYMKHGFSNGVEAGVVKDARGDNVAIGHVITGIAGGIKNSNQGQRITLFERIISSDPADSLPSKGLRGLVK
jgi:hypothetical protein